MSSRMSSSRRSQVHSSRDTATPSRTPASSRHANNNNGRQQRQPTPEYEPMCTPLNAAGQRSLAALLSGSSFKQIQKHLNQAGEKLTETAAEVNERATDSRVRYENSKRKKRSERNKKNTAASRRKSGDDDEEEGTDDEEQEDEEMESDEENEEEEEEEDENISRARKLEQLDEKVKEVTVQLEERMRGIVDGEYKLSAMQEVVGELHKAAEEADAEANARERQSRLRSRRNVEESEDEEMEDPGMQEDENEDETAIIVPSQAMIDKLNEVDTEWEEQSLAQRYAQNNTYVGFYRIVHNSKHPGDEIPPVPHPSTWFSHLESPTAAEGGASPVHGRIRDDGQSPDDEDEEVAIERERISLKCPLTFSTFEDPVKSTKCVHSFERQAIEDLIRNSTMTIAAGDQDFQGGGRGARARRVRAVQCPVCSVTLTLNNLKRDPVLLRRVLRAKAAEQREEEEAQFEGRRHHRKGGRKSGFTIASDDDDEEVSIDDDDDENEMDEEEENMRTRIKRERSRYSSRATRGVDEIEDD